jgi:cell division protein FtsI (penicillin-binding protein 3)
MTTQAKQRLRLIVTLFALAFAMVIGRAVYIQVIQADALAARAHGQQSSTVEIRTPRGEIKDRDGNVLAEDVPAKDLWAHPTQVVDPTQTASYIAQKLGYSLKHKKKLAREVKRLAALLTVPGVTSDLAQVRIIRRLDPTVAAEIMAGHPPGLFLTDTIARAYPANTVAAQLLGFVDDNDSGADGAGIEQQYNRLLTGRSAKKLEIRGPGGISLDSVTVRRPVAGHNVTLTIDRSIQQKVQSVLDATVRSTRAHTATAIVLDPRTGEILAMATAPSYDNNAVHDLSQYQFQRDSHNMAVEYSYEPGSTFKVVTFAAALTQGWLRPDTPFHNLPYKLQVGDRVIHDDVPRGPISLTAAQILQQSSNVGTVTIAEMVQKEPLYSWIRKWGFGRPTGIGLHEANPALLPPDRWYSSSIGNIPIGQGIAVTPLQMAAMYSGIANGGVMVQPHVIKRISGQPAPKVERRRILSPAVDHTLVDMLKGVVDTAAGTGVRAQVPGYTVAGKTGTAQKALAHGLGYSTRNYVASFVGFLPADDPRVEVMVVVDSPRSNIFGGIVAAPAFQQIASFLTKDLAIPPDRPVD